MNTQVELNIVNRAIWEHNHSIIDKHYSITENIEQSILT